MEEKDENVVEETTTQNQQDPGDENVVKIDKSKFNSADDDTVLKVDLSKPPTPKKEENETKDEIKENNANDSGVVAEPENADATQEQEKN